MEGERDYHRLYSKYKHKYLKLKEQLGGQVVFDLTDDDYLDINALENIYIRLADKRTNGVVYEKVIKVKEIDEKGTVFTRDYVLDKEHTYDINRGNVEKLVRNINRIWNLSPYDLDAEWTDTGKDFNRDFDEENSELDDYDRYPSRYVDDPKDYSKFSLFIRVGDKVWPERKGWQKRFKRSKLSRTGSKELYSDIVSQILSFE